MTKIRRLAAILAVDVVGYWRFGVSLAIALRLAPATPIFGSSSKGRGG